jgi:hypothetical protein
VARRLAGPADRAVAWAMRAGFRKGLGDGSRVWFALGAVAVGIRLFQRLASPGKPIVISEDLLPGESIVIRHLNRGE